MGKKRITQLLEQLEANRQQELQNAAAIFTVAQVAVDKLQEQIPSEDDAGAIAALPPAPVLLDKGELEQRYGSYNHCRKAAKAQGIKFKGNPSWKQLVAAFRYREAIQQLVKSYVDIHPNPDLQGISIELTLK